MLERDDIGYGRLVDEAMREVVCKVLKKVEAEGLPGRHHCFISFRTHFPGVIIADTLKEKYPEEMTIVLQHQYWDLTVDEHQFSVGLSFNNVREHLVIPFAAMTAFADPSVKFGLQFQPLEEMTDETTGNLPGLEGEEVEIPEDAGEKIVTLDAFRKK